MHEAGPRFYGNAYEASVRLNRAGAKAPRAFRGSASSKDLSRAHGSLTELR
ncbi:hypothetical protein PLANPX_5471 [Lacipirellula parvula]|uniref:Uncharacterized protein n=1 Tax=Lacipirellula parvula TaxID=2650471 RepID=A0A5K7XQF8_9BACT|nr:hypothetical protein PLANPX_5471 [Lacipirellula parvula]